VCRCSDLLQVMHKGLVVTHRVGHLLRSSGHDCWGHREFRDVHGRLGVQGWSGGLGGRPRDRDRGRRGGPRPRGTGPHRDVVEDTSVGLRREEHKENTRRRQRRGGVHVDDIRQKSLCHIFVLFCRVLFSPCFHLMMLKKTHHPCVVFLQGYTFVYFLFVK